MPGNFARDIILQRLLDEQMAKAEIKPSKELAVEILKHSLKQMDPQMVELIKQQAVMQGKTLDQSIEEMASNPEMQKNAAMQDYLEKKVLSAVKEATPEEVRKFYDDNQEQFKVGPRVKVAHILYAAGDGKGEVTPEQEKAAEEKGESRPRGTAEESGEVRRDRQA